MGRIIAIANQKGGVGKTTTAINLAYFISSRNSKILAIDIDPQANATSGLGIEKSKVERTVYDVLVSGRPIRESITPTPFPNFDIIPSNSHLTGAEVELVPMLAREYRLKRSLDEISQEYDFVIIDCPPSLGLLTINAMTSANSLLIPIQCEYYALEGLAQLLKTFELVRKNLNPGLEIEGVILTMADSRTNLTSQVIEEVRRAFGKKVYQTIIPRSVKLGEAPSFGQPIAVYAPSSTGSVAYQSLCDEIIGQTRNQVLQESTVS